MSRRLDSSVIIESNKEGVKSIGTGFVISATPSTTYIATCAHVVHDLGGGEYLVVAGQRVEVVNGTLPSGLDLALLSTSPPLEKPLIPIQAATPSEGEIYIEGFSRIEDMIAFETIHGELAKSREIEHNRQRIQMWEINTEQELRPGYSGSPVILKETNCAIAVVVHSIGRRGGNAISVAGLRLLWNEILELLIQEPAHILPNRDRLTEEIDYFAKKSAKNAGVQEENLRNLNKSRRELEKDIAAIKTKIEDLQSVNTPSKSHPVVDNDDYYLGLSKDSKIANQTKSEIDELKKQKEELEGELSTIDEDIMEINALREYYEAQSAFEEKIRRTSKGRRRRLREKIVELRSRLRDNDLSSFAASVIRSDIERYFDYVGRIES